MKYEDIIYEERDSIAFVTISREEKQNALRPATMAELSDAFGRASASTGANVILLAGAGDKAFCAGADVTAFAAAKSAHEVRKVYDAFVGLSDAMRAVQVPIVARVHGLALGGGFALALMSDIVIAESGTRFGVPEIKLGLFPMIVLPTMFESMAPKAIAQMSLTGSLITAEKALQWGAINEVVSSEDLDERALAVAASIAEKSPLSLHLGRHALYAMKDMNYDSALEYGRTVGAELMLSDDAQARIRAFAQK